MFAPLGVVFLLLRIHALTAEVLLGYNSQSSTRLHAILHYYQGIIFYSVSTCMRQATRSLSR